MADLYTRARELIDQGAFVETSDYCGEVEFDPAGFDIDGDILLVLSATDMKDLLRFMSVPKTTMKGEKGPIVRTLLTARLQGRMFVVATDGAQMLALPTDPYGEDFSIKRINTPILKAAMYRQRGETMIIRTNGKGDIMAAGGLIFSSDNVNLHEYEGKVEKLLKDAYSRQNLAVADAQELLSVIKNSSPTVYINQRGKDIIVEEPGKGTSFNRNLLINAITGFKGEVTISIPHGVHPLVLRSNDRVTLLMPVDV